MANTETNTKLINDKRVIFLVDVWKKGDFDKSKKGDKTVKPVRRQVHLYADFNVSKMNEGVFWQRLQFDPRIKLTDAKGLSFSWEGNMFDILGEEGRVMRCCVMTGADTHTTAELISVKGNWLPVGFASTYNKGQAMGPVVSVRRDEEQTLLGEDPTDSDGGDRGVEYRLKYYITSTDGPAVPVKFKPKEWPSDKVWNECGHNHHHTNRFFEADEMNSAEDAEIDSGLNESQQDATTNFEDMMDANVSNSTVYGDMPWGGQLFPDVTVNANEGPAVAGDPPAAAGNPPAVAGDVPDSTH